MGQDRAFAGEMRHTAALLRKCNVNHRRRLEHPPFLETMQFLFLPAGSLRFWAISSARDDSQRVDASGPVYL
jgi:hypothetical protein